VEQPDYIVHLSHQDEGDNGWRVEVYDSGNGANQLDILMFAEENVELRYAVSHAEDAIDRDQKRGER
jgi:hypothetical protein